jgi:hypothetical protein
MNTGASVELAFRPDPRVLSELSGSEPAEILSRTVLIVPVRFAVGGHSVLPGLDDPQSQLGSGWFLQPLVGFVVSLRDALDATRRTGGGTIDLSLGWHPITLRRLEGDLVSIRYRDRTAAMAQLDTFQSAVDEFRRGVGSWIRDSDSELVRHALWSDRFGGEPT